MFLFASQYVMVRFRDEEVSALQFAMLLMMVTWQSSPDGRGILAVALATMAYEVVTVRVWHKALFNVITQTATFGLAFAVFHRLDPMFVTQFGDVGTALAVAAAGVTQEILMSIALWIPVRLSPREWFQQEKLMLLSLGAATVGTAWILVWPPALLVGLLLVLALPLKNHFRALS